MMRSMALALCLMAGLTIFLGLPRAVVAKDLKLTFVTDDRETFPYYMGELRIPGQDPGISVEIIQRAADKVGVKVTFERQPWKRALFRLGSNQFDGAFNASYKESRMKLGKYPMKEGKVDPSRSLATVQHMFYKLKTSAATWDGKVLSGLVSKVAVVHSYSIVDDLKKAGIPLTTAIEPDLNLRKVLGGRVEMLVEEQSKMDRMLAKDSDSAAKMSKMEIPFKVKPTYLMLSHYFVTRNPKAAEKIWDSIGEINQSDWLKKRYEYYYKTY